MRLLVVTQKVDKKDPVLGFFHRWIEEFATRLDFITVICLETGEYSLPKNVKVLSLGKKQNVQSRDLDRFVYIFRFYKYIWQERANYDSVFVHMNQEYVILGWKFWKLWRKKIFLWRNHARGSLWTHIAVSLSDKVFCTSLSSYTARFSKTKIMPAGIDTDLYADNIGEYKRNTILFFGRVSPVKNVHVFIEALLKLEKSGADFHADIIGDTTDQWYEESLHKRGARLENIGRLVFHPALSHEQTSGLYKKYSFYVNLTSDGSLDKTILEAMAARVPVLVLNSAFRGQIHDICCLTDLNSLSVSEKMKTLLQLSAMERENIGVALQEYVKREHDLKYLVELLMKEMA